MSGYRQRPFTKPGSGHAVLRICGSSSYCHRSVAVVESIMGTDTCFLCTSCAKAAREAWASAVEPAAPRCNSCEDGRLLPGSVDGVVPILRCVDCDRDVPSSAMRAAA